MIQDYSVLGEVHIIFRISDPSHIDFFADKSHSLFLGSSALSYGLLSDSHIWIPYPQDFSCAWDTLEMRFVPLT